MTGSVICLLVNSGTSDPQDRRNLLVEIFYEFHPDLEPEDVDALFLAKEHELRKEFGLSREEMTWSNLYSNYEDAEGVNLAPMTLQL